MTRKYIILFILFIGTWINANAQVNPERVRVFASNNFKGSETAVYVKWLAVGVISTEGFNVYRTVSGTTEWEKLNTTPILMLPKVPDSLTDADAIKFYNMYKQLKTADIPKMGMLHIKSIIKAVENNYFAEALGIIYKDNSAKKGVAYQYNVRKIENGSEVDLGTSSPLIVGKWERQKPVAQTTVERKYRMMNMKWRPEPERYFSIDIYRWTKDNKEKKKINEGPIILNKEKNGKYADILFVDTKISRDTAYYYQFVGVDYFGSECKASDPIFVPTKNFVPPSAPFNLISKQTKTNVFLTWKSGNEVDLKGFNIYRSLFYDSLYIRINNKLLGKTDSLYVDKLDDPGEYFYMVSSVNNDDLENTSNPYIADVKDVIPPAMPRGLRAKVDTGRIKLKWHSNSEKDLAGYYILKSVVGAKDYFIVNKKPIKDTVYTEVLAKNIKDKFIFQVVAVDTNMNRSEPSKAVYATMPDVTPPASPFIKYVRQAPEGLRIVWIANVDNDLAKYIVYRKGGSDTTFKEINSKVPNTDTVFVDDDIKANISYSYALAAVDSADNISGKSNVFSAKHVDNKCKVIIKSFKAYSHNKKVALAFETDKGADFNGCVIYRKEAGGDYTKISGKVEGDSFDDTNIVAGKTYIYQLKAFDKLGNVVKSAEVEVKTE